MNPRLLILILVAVGMAIYFASIKGRTQSNDALISNPEADPVPFQGTLEDLELSGKEPEEDPDLAVLVEVDRSRGKNRLYFTITEAHGFYIEQFQVRFWYVKDGVTSHEDSPVSLSQFFDRYLPANGTLRVCLEVVPAELTKVGGDIGDSQNWKAEIEWHGRARVQNPDPMPPRTDLISGTSSCD